MILPTPTWMSPDQNIRLYNGDCLDLLPLFEDKSVHSIITDIPYGAVNRKSHGLRNLDKGKGDISTFSIEQIMGHLIRIPQGSIYVWCGMEQISPLRIGFTEAKMATRLGVWQKSNPSPMNGQHLWLSGLEYCMFARHKKAYFDRHCKVPLWKGPIVRNPIHPTEKPVWLLSELIEASVPPNEWVLDFCMGSGSTGEAAIKLGRKFIGIELDEEFFNKAKERIEKIYQEQPNANL